MAYTVLARKYRSTSFDTVVGQEPIARTLQNSIKEDRVAHAYLFCGTRGVGKTSMARIFAKALNAVDEKGNEISEVAKAIMTGRDTDVIEIDAASHNSVENARELIANSVYRPLRGRYKVYIIDEVHMLSIQAFNALLKTMEEPPEHVVFILCTTETHKVPATIQSRCQRFDFKNIPTAKIAEHLKEIIDKEKLQAEPDLLHMVARLGEGSMRDALSLLDRLMAAGDKKLTVKLLEDLLGLPDRTLILALLEAFADGDAAAALARAEQLLNKGIGPEQLVGSIADGLRDLMVMSACGAETDLVEITGEARQEAGALAARFDAAALSHMIALCDAVGRNARLSSAPRALLDALVVRLALAEKFADAAAIVAGGGGRAGPPGGAARGAGGPAGKTAGMLNPGRERAAEHNNGPEQVARETSVAAAAADSSRERPLVERPAAVGGDAGDTARGGEAEADAAEPDVDEPLEPTVLGVEVGPVSFWEGVRVAAQAKPALVPVLSRVEVKGLEAGRITLGCSSMMAAAVRTRVRAIEELCRQVAGGPMTVELDVQEEPAAAEGETPDGQADEAGAESSSAADAVREVASNAEAEEQLQAPTVDPDAVTSDPLVQEALSLFNARIVNIVPRSE